MALRLKVLKNTFEKNQFYSNTKLGYKDSNDFINYRLQFIFKFQFNILEYF